MQQKRTLKQTLSMLRKRELLFCEISPLCYQISEKKFTKRNRQGQKTEDQLFCLSLDEALRYANYLWKLDGAATDNFTLAGSHAMGYWLRTPAASSLRAWRYTASNSSRSEKFISPFLLPLSLAIQPVIINSF